MSNEVGGWQCAFCLQLDRHRHDCLAPSGRCRACGYAIDEHSGVDTRQLACPKRGVKE